MPTRSARLLPYLQRLLSSGPLPGDNDADLLRRFADQHDETAFATLVHRHGPMVQRVCQRVLGDAHAIEDAFQATFLVLAQQPRSIRRPEALTSWLFGVARRIALKARTEQSRRIRMATAAYPETYPDPQPNPLDQLSAREMLDILDEEVQLLPERYRLPVILCCLEGKSQEEAAQQLGWTPGSVKGRLERGRSRLHHQLAKRGLTLTAVLAGLELSRAMSLAVAPSVLASSTIQAALALVHNPKAALAGLSPRVVELTHFAMQGAGVGRLTTLLVLGASMVVAAAGLLAYTSRLEPPNDAAEVAPAENAEPERKESESDPLPPEAVARIGTARLRHGGKINAVAFAPDQKQMASVSRDWSLRMWDTDTGKEIAVSRLGGWGLCLAYSADGKMLACATREGVIHVREASAEGKELARIKAPNSPIFYIDFIDAQTLLTVGQDRCVRIWGWAQGNKVLEVQRPDPISHAALSPDRKTLLLNESPANGKATALTFWNHEQNHVQRTIPLGGPVQSVAWRPDGKMFAVRHSEKIHLWDAAGKEIATLDCATPLDNALAFVPTTNRLAVGTQEGMVQVWDYGTGKKVQEWKGHRVGVEALAVSADGKKLISGAGDNCLDLRDLATGKEVFVSAGHQGQVMTVACSSEESLMATGSIDGTVRLWHTETHRQLQVLPHDAQEIRCLTFLCQKGVLVTGSSDGLRWWDTTTGKVRKQMTLPKNTGVRCLTFAAKHNLLAVGCDDHVFRLIDPEKSSIVHTFAAEQGNALTAAFSPQGNLLATGSSLGKSIVLWDPISGKEVARIAIPSGVTSLAFSRDGRVLLSGNIDSVVRAWEVASGKERVRWGPLARGDWTFTCITPLPDGRSFAVGVGSSYVHVFDLATGDERGLFKGHLGWVRGLGVTHDGRQLVSGSEDTAAMVWNLEPILTAKTKEVPLSREDQEKLWIDLLEEDGALVFQAMKRWYQAGAQTPELLGARLKPTLDEKEIGPITPDRLRLLRALEILERQGTLQARQALTTLADSSPRGSWLAREARLCLERMGK